MDAVEVVAADGVDGAEEAAVGAAAAVAAGKFIYVFICIYI